MMMNIFLAVIAEFGAETLAGKEDAALDCAEGKAEFVGDFVVFVAGYIHAEGNAVFVGKLGEGLRDFLNGVGAFGRSDAGVLRDVDMVKIFALVNYCGLAHLLAIVVDEDVAHDGEDPTLEVDVVNVFGFVVESFEGGFLKKVFSLFAVCCELVSEAQEVAL